MFLRWVFFFSANKKLPSPLLLIFLSICFADRLYMVMVYQWQSKFITKLRRELTAFIYCTLKGFFSWTIRWVISTVTNILRWVTNCFLRPALCLLLEEEDLIWFSSNDCFLLTVWSSRIPRCCLTGRIPCYWWAAAGASSSLERRWPRTPPNPPAPSEPRGRRRRGSKWRKRIRRH